MTYHTEIIRGKCYGTNSRKTYDGFCETLKWDKNQSYLFGRHWASLYARNADTDRKRDVWFITHSNYTDSKAESGNYTNYIKTNTIIEIIAEKSDLLHNSDRIVFAKNKSRVYVFLGVYAIIKNTDGKRVFKRIYDNYPINNKC